MKKIIFIHPGLGTRNIEDVYFAVAAELTKRDFEVEFVTGTKRAERELRVKNIPAHNIEEAVIAMMGKSSSLRLKEQNFAKKYGIDLDKVYRSDCFLQRKSIDYKERKAMAYLSAWEDYFSHSRPSLVVNMDNARILRLSCYYVAQRLGIPTICGNGRGPISGTMFWDSDIMLNGWVKEEFLAQEVGSEDEAKIAAYISGIKQSRPIHGGGSRRLNLKRATDWLKEYVENLVLYTFNRESRDVIWHPIERPLHALLVLIRPRVAPRYYSKPDLNQKYIFLPLHFIDDAQMTARGFEFIHQDEVVEICARSIPADYLLYVKEHPQWKGSTPLRWLKRISSLSNVKLVPPDTNAHDLIQHSQCIIVINSTVAWEALLYYKPVVVLGKPFYFRHGVTFDIENKEELSGKIREALETKEPSQEKVRRLINAVMKSSYDASFYYPGREFECVCNLEAENIGKIADSILAEHSKPRE